MNFWLPMLNEIQKKLKAPKGQKNTFGNYAYRSCEDILEAVKPLLGDAVLTLTDDIVQVGSRYYVKAVATLQDKDVVFSTTAFARESEVKKGMDESQITGAASSYARKYALNGLFCIDDTKDADTKDNTDKPAEAGKTTKPAAPVRPVKPVEPVNNLPTITEVAEIEKIKILLEEAAGENKIDIGKLTVFLRELGKGRYPSKGKSVDVAVWMVKNGKVEPLLVRDNDGKSQ